MQKNMKNLKIIPNYMKNINKKENGENNLNFVKFVTEQSQMMDGVGIQKQKYI